MDFFMLYHLFIYPIELILQGFYSFFVLYFNNHGFAVIGVSLAVSIFTLPLYNIAERWQKIERDTQLAMQPKINKIKSVFKGDERYMILSTYYRQQRYHPAFALRSSISLLIQVPFFIAAYHFLSHYRFIEPLTNSNICPFLFIPDLNKHDTLFSIGSIPIHLLPIIMTLINIIAGTIYTKGFPVKEKIQLYTMAALFLVLLYNSPSGLVLYWTCNNIFSLIKHCLKKTKQPSFIFYIISTAVSVTAAFWILTFTNKTIVKKIIICCISIIIVLVPFWKYLILRFFYPRLKAIEQKPKKRTALFIICMCALFLLSGFFIPSALVSTSAQEFSFIDEYTNPLQLMLFPLIQAAGFFLLWGTLLYALFSNKVKTVLTYAAAVFLSWALINVFIFTGNYGTVLSNLHFTSGILKMPHLHILLIDTAIFTLCALLILVLFRYIPLKFIIPVFAIVNFSLLFSGMYNYGKIEKTYTTYAKAVVKANGSIAPSNSVTPVFHLSKTKQNVIVLMIDRAISSFVPSIFNELPKTAAQFKGFVWYPNTVTTNGHTMMGSPPLYGGYEYTPEKINARSDEPLVKKHNEALCVMPRLFSEHGFNTVVTDASWANYSLVPDNSIFSQWQNVTAQNLSGVYTYLWNKENDIVLVKQSSILKRNFIFFSFFRMTPPFLRGGVYDDGKWWDPEAGNSGLENIINLYSVLDYLPRLTDFTSDTNTFCCIVNELTHENEYLQYPEYKPVTTITNVGINPFSNTVQHQIYHVNAAALKLLGKWFEYLQQNGVYDNTKIIIVSDHGTNERFPAFEHFPQTGNMYPGQANALLMVKDFNADFPLKTDTTFMTNADVPFLAAQGSIQNPINPFTQQPITDGGKKDGFDFYVTHRYVPEAHNKNTFILDDELWHVKKDIFKPENWSHIK
ncbi:YidC/Oxa1 family membrane protein insertase [Treponema lecithinolyticum]|uniref:Membrane protein insertase, YidC/Oxa1 family n=1 Tax=Treponema lecithinolyticum ATCC 700332 TaxID=1321815 RepID=A0ABN0P1N7_TRELE|nr:YidC/Oxa1 family membrane protein insertase [Treponema lecithinolyticum]ERJ94492.1 membrane protein insertase, YidC/Oxa1 family [Treponema lecithinolyticum ATCC 700332]